MPNRRRLQRLALLLLLLGSITVSAQDGLYDLPSPAVVHTESGTLAYTRLGRLLVANRMTGTASLIRPLNKQLDAEFEVGRTPESVAITPDGATGLVVSRDDGLLSVIDLNDEAVRAVYRVGNLPAHVIAADADSAYISRHEPHEIAQIDLNSGRVIQRIPTPPYPTALALWGDFLYVTHLYSGDVSLVYLPLGEVVRTVPSGASLSRSITLDTRNALAYIPGSIVNADASQAPDARFVPVVNVLDLRTLQVLPEQRIWLSLADRNVHLPYALTLNSLRNQLIVAHAGSNALSVIDLRDGTALAHVQVGANPRDVVFSRDNLTIYAHDAVDQTLSYIDIGFYALADQFALSNRNASPQQSLGARLFHGADDPRLSWNHAASCAACHADGRRWQGNETPTLPDQPTGKAAFDLNAHIQQMQGGNGLAADGLEYAALLAYLTHFTSTTQ